MKTIILAGGVGSRMREETEFKPKPMVEIGGNPILWHIMMLYNFYKHKEFIVCMGYKQESIIQYFLNLDSLGKNLEIDLGKENNFVFLDSKSELKDNKVILAHTGEETDTGERIRRVKEYFSPGETFMMTYGDGLSDVNIQELINFHNNHDGIVTFSKTKPQSRFGVIKTNDENMVINFDEKGKLENDINCGFMVLDYEVFDYIDENDSFEQNTLKKIAADNKLYAFSHQGYFQPMDTYREYKHLNNLWNDGKAPWKIWDE